MRGRVEEIIVESGREVRSSIRDSHIFSRGNPKSTLSRGNLQFTMFSLRVRDSTEKKLKETETHREKIDGVLGLTEEKQLKSEEARSWTSLSHD